MINLQRIKTSDTCLYQFMESLMQEAFPPAERRLPVDLHRYIDMTDNFHACIIEDNVPIGIFNYWEFSQFYYVEHFAVLSEYRNSGYGRRTLELVTSLQFNKPIVLEVEPPDTDIARRRTDFYHRCGFLLWNNAYTHPPYHGTEYLPMRLMVYGNLLPSDYEEVRRTLHTNVYGIKEA